MRAFVLGIDTKALIVVKRGSVRGGSIDATAVQQYLQGLHMRVQVEIDRFTKVMIKAPRNIFTYLEQDVGVAPDSEDEAATNE